MTPKKRKAPSDKGAGLTVEQVKGWRLQFQRQFANEHPIVLSQALALCDLALEAIRNRQAPRRLT